MNPIVHKRIVLGLLLIGVFITSIMLSGCSSIPVMKKTAYDIISVELQSVDCETLCSNGCEKGKQALLLAIKSKLGL